MALLRLRQRALTAVSPHQGNRRYLIPNFLTGVQVAAAGSVGNDAFDVTFTQPMDQAVTSSADWTLNGIANTLAGAGVWQSATVIRFTLATGTIGSSDVLTLDYGGTSYVTADGNSQLEPFSGYPVTNNLFFRLASSSNLASSSEPASSA